MTDLVEIRRCRTFPEAEQLALVLTAVGIECRLSPADGTVAIYVVAPEAGRAREQLAVYERENTAHDVPSPPLRERWHGIEAAMAYGIVITAFFVAERMSVMPVDWVTVGAAQAGLILDGEWWRALTSLTLHADLGHLLGNLVFGVGAGVLAAQLLGSGLAWFVILMAGCLGNGLNAVIQSPEHTAIGASTGVFGALGILSGYRQGSGGARSGIGLRRWAPVAAGIMLLAFLGFGGERTDILAHVTGFGVGVAIGLALVRVSQRIVLAARVQRTCGGLACALLSLAWLLALYV